MGSRVGVSNEAQSDNGLIIRINQFLANIHAIAQIRDDHALRQPVGGFARISITMPIARANSGDSWRRPATTPNSSIIATTPIRMSGVFRRSRRGRFLPATKSLATMARFASTGRGSRHRTTHKQERASFHMKVFMRVCSRPIKASACSRYATYPREQRYSNRMKARPRASMLHWWTNSPTTSRDACITISVRSSAALSSLPRISINSRWVGARRALHGDAARRK